MTRTVACVTVRMSSTRLPLKGIRDILPGVTLLDFLIHRIKDARRVDEIYICTSTEPLDDVCEDVAIRNEVKIYRGSLENMVERMNGVRHIESPDFLVRLTGDNPFIDPHLLDAQIEMAERESLDYVRLTDVPLGATGEVFRSEVLDLLNEDVTPDVSEYLMLYLFDPAKFKCGLLKPLSEDHSNLVATVDTDEDLKKARRLASHLKAINDFSLKRLVNELQQIPDGRDNSAELVVKLPRGQTMTYAEFHKMMELRKSKSMKRELPVSSDSIS